MAGDASFLFRTGELHFITLVKLKLERGDAGIKPDSGHNNTF